MAGAIYSEKGTYSPKRPSNPCCCCCCCRCLFGLCSCVVSLMITLLITIALILLIFFLWPRMPDVQYLNSKSSASAGMTGPPKDYNVTIQIDNPNYIGWTVNKLDAQLVDRSTGAEFGKGNVTDYGVEKRSEQNVTIPFTLTLNPNDPTATRVINICGSPPTPMPATIKASLDVRGLSWIYTPKVSRDIELTCPK